MKGWLMFGLWLLLTACTTAVVPDPGSALLTTTAERPNPHIHLYYPANSAKAIVLAVQDLQQDLQQQLPDVRLSAGSDIGPAEELPTADLVLVVGERRQLQSVPWLDSESRQQLAAIAGPRGGVMHLQRGARPLLLLAGADVQGTQYSVYDFSHQFLRTDALTYWTGHRAEPITLTWLRTQLQSFHSQQIAPPVVPLLVYFENDVDELANYRSPKLQYDWPTFTALIDSLVRLRYNGIELFDMLGRVEFYQRPEYVSRYPGYQLDQAYLQRMIDYIHDKGMLLQVDMMMGRQLGELSEQAAGCWTNHQQEWRAMWQHYLQNTPLGQADIFSLRPRHQVWDWPYQSQCQEDRTEVFNQVYAALGQVLDDYKPGAIKVCTCYHDGMALFNQGFQPPQDFIIAWSDNGWGDFDLLPLSAKGHAMGSYVHAGFWLNHDVADPYPARVEQVMRRMYQQHNADRYMMVNGQTFRPFLLNIAAYAESARLGTAFDSVQFTSAWLRHYFGEAATKPATQALQQLHQAHQGNVGYVEILWQIKVLHGFLADLPVQQPGKQQFRVSAAQIQPWFDDTAPRIAALQQGLLAAASGASSSKNPQFYHDFIQLPLQLYLDLLHYNQLLLQLAQLKLTAPSQWHGAEGAALLHQAEQQLQLIYQRRQQGDQQPRWQGWYLIENRRPNNGFPQASDLAAIRQARAV